ncbi:MAG: DUF2520 domain-containing protein [Muribaculaceae bacterium]|nr:DUF2520 domain-containing protein [Muribaculaceae bacterium]
MERSGGRRRARIVVLGTGNVASHLIPALAAENDVLQVWTRTRGKRVSLPGPLSEIPVIYDQADIVPDADFYIIAVSDDAIAPVAEMLANSGAQGIVAHTSGSFPLERLREIFPTGKSGVFYPLQTFSKDVAVDISKVPFFIEGSDTYTADCLVELAKTVSTDVKLADSEVRGHLHVAAVFANNFVNYMWDVADSYLKEKVDLDIKIFAPLLQETLHKAIENGPRHSQTGPAVRGDKKVIEAHLAKLNEEDATVYRMLTDLITKKHES